MDAMDEKLCKKEAKTAYLDGELPSVRKMILLSGNAQKILLATCASVLLLMATACDSQPDGRLATAAFSPSGLELSAESPPASSTTASFIQTSPTSSYTHTPKPTGISTPTPSPTATFAWTPIPTLAPDAALEALLQLYADNSGCELPCWWGITPGKTTWTEAQTKLMPLGWSSGPWGDGGVVRYEFAFDVPTRLDPEGAFEPILGVQNDKVKGISLNTRWLFSDFDYSLNGLLEMLSAPDEIWLEVVTETQSEPYYEMDLFYPSRGILLSATGTVQIEDERLHICPQQFSRGTFPPAIMLWSPAEHYKYSEVFLATLGRDDVDTSDFYPLEEWSPDFDREDFYTTYLDPQTSTCFEVVPIATTE